MQHSRGFNGGNTMNRDIDTSDFQKEINKTIGKKDNITLKDKRHIVKMVVHYSDGATITLEGGKVGRTGDWE